MRKLFVGVAGLLAVLLPLSGVGGSPVADAAEKRDLVALRSLVAQKMDVNAAQDNGSTALQWATHWATRKQLISC